MAEYDYDLIVIGAGPGGLVCTKELIEQGLTAEMTAKFITGIVIKKGSNVLGGTARDADGNVLSS